MYHDLNKDFLRHIRRRYEPFGLTITAETLGTPQLVGMSMLLELVVAVGATAVDAVFAVVKLRRRAPLSPTRMWVSGVEEANFRLEYPGGIIPCPHTPWFGRRDFPGLPEEALAKIEERHFAVCYNDGAWWVEDLGSKYGTYTNGVRVGKAILKEGGDNPVFKQCGAVKRAIVEGIRAY